MTRLPGDHEFFSNLLEFIDFLLDSIVVFHVRLCPFESSVFFGFGDLLAELLCERLNRGLLGRFDAHYHQIRAWRFQLDGIRHRGVKSFGSSRNHRQQNACVGTAAGESMQPLSEAAFARQLRALSAQERLAFLARLWEARGYTTRVDGSRLIASQEASAGDRDTISRTVPTQELTIVVTGPIGYGSVDTTADVVVTTRETALVRRVTTDAGAELVSPADLLERLLYGIDRETANTITNEHLGRSLMQPPAEDSGVPGSRVAGAAVIGVVVIAIIVSSVGLPLAMNEDVSSQAQVSSTEPATTPVVETGDQLPDGLNDDGVTDPQAATAAHKTLVQGSARELRFEYFAVGEGTLLGGITEYSATGRYINDSRYAFNVTRADGEGLRAHREQFVVDGVTLQREQVGNETEYLRTEDRPAARWDGFRQSTIQLYTAALSVNQTSVREVSSEGKSILRLDLSGTPSESILRAERIDAVAYVTREGRLTRLQMEYINEATGDPIRVVVGVRLLEDPTITRPEWYGTALNQTA